MLHECTFSFNPKRNHPCVKDLHFWRLEAFIALKIDKSKSDETNGNLKLL